MASTLKLPVGIENFEEIRKLGFYYIDKTRLIEQFWRVDAVVDVIVSLNDVGIVAIAVGHHDGHEGTSIVCYSYFHAVGIA